MTDTTNTTTVTNLEISNINEWLPVDDLTISITIGETSEEYVLPTVPYMPDQHPVTSLAAAVVRLHQRVEALEATLAELKGEDRG